MRWHRTLSVVAMVLTLGCAATKQPLTTDDGTAQEAAAAPVGVEVGNRAPSFSLPDTDGATVALEDYRGNPVALVFYRGEW